MPDEDPVAPGGAEQEEQIRELIARIQINQQRMDALQQQANLIQLSLNDLDNALKALTTLEGKDEGHEMLVPIGAGSFVHARLASPDKVLIGLGAGVSVEKSVADSKGIIQSRRSELEKVLLETTGAMEKVAAELVRLQQEAQKYQ
ncbi:prefoldin subunit alpha [Methanocella conradii]|uniref:prefoldin subunit alpha n=1 Tax=Methanocella conradii TaxID=1175444 RepID=UPI00157C0ED3|nr:prefoldin subunit alpha [Methanocella conradii]